MTKVALVALDLAEAQNALGLTNEEMAEKLGVTERTWRRWKEAGEVPTGYILLVATILRLDSNEVIDLLPSETLQTVRSIWEYLDGFMRTRPFTRAEILARYYEQDGHDGHGHDGHDGHQHTHLDDGLTGGL